MSKVRFVISICCFVIVLSVMTAGADQYDDCLDNCNHNADPCIEQARLSAGNVQEEQDMVAACNNNKSECIKACHDAATQPQSTPQEQPQEQPQNQ
jgi:hypothetical protein